MVHALLYHRDSWKSNKEWSKKLVRKQENVKTSDYGMWDYSNIIGEEVSWLFQYKIQFYLRLTMTEIMYDYSKQLWWSILEHSRSWWLPERFWILWLCNSWILLSGLVTHWKTLLMGWVYPIFVIFFWDQAHCVVVSREYGPYIQKHHE